MKNVEKVGIRVLEERQSTHVFFFPFTWELLRYKKDSNLNQHRQMHKEHFETIDSWVRHRDVITEDRQYNEQVYFYKSVQPILYEKSDNSMVCCYEKTNRAEDDYLKLTVEGKDYVLLLGAIRLNLYKTGIGILVLEAINTSYSKLADIIAINGLSKCVYPYVLPVEKAQEDFFPEHITLQIGQKLIEEAFESDYKSRPMAIGHFLMAVLGQSFTNKRKQTKSNTFAIEPLFSNRMFTLCLYRNQMLLHQLQNKEVKDSTLRQFMVFSRKEKVVDVSYIALPNVIYGIGRFVLMGVVADVNESYVYEHLVTLAIVQRATLLHFSNQLAYISALTKEQLVYEIGNLYEIYIQFVNQMYFDEVTVDVQGTSIYESLFKQLRIREAMKEVDFEIRQVHEYSSLIQKKQSQVRMDLLTIIGAILVIPTFVTGLFGMNVLEDRFDRWWVHKDIFLFLNSYVLLPIEVVMLIYIWCIKNHRHHKLWGGLLAISLLLSLVIVIMYGCGLG